MKMEQTEHSEMSAYKIQMPGNHLKQRIQLSEHGESLKSRNLAFLTYKDEQLILAIIHLSPITHIKSHNSGSKTHKIPLHY
jgi:hypothetical protein